MPITPSSTQGTIFKPNCRAKLPVAALMVVPPRLPKATCMPMAFALCAWPTRPVVADIRFQTEEDLKKIENDIRAIVTEAADFATNDPEPADPPGPVHCNVYSLASATGSQLMSNVRF